MIRVSEEKFNDASASRPLASCTGSATLLDSDSDDDKMTIKQEVKVI